MKTADLIFQAVTEQKDVGKRLVVKTGGFCLHDHMPLYALTRHGAFLYERLSIPTCLKCGLAYHPLNGFGSRDFDGVDDVVNLGSPSVLDNVNTATVLAWINADSMGENSAGTVLHCAGGAYPFRQWIMLEATNTAKVEVTTDATHAVSKASAETIAFSTWLFLATTYDNAGDRKMRLYKGTPTAMIAELTYVTQTAGTGTIDSDAAVNKCIGNRVDLDTTFDGKIAHVLWFNRVLSVNEMIYLQFGRLITNGLIGYWPLWGVAASEPDLSGNLNNGAVTGAILANHPPIGRYVPMPRAFPSMGAAAEYINVSDSAVGTDIIVGIEEWLTITDTALGTDIAYLLGEVLIDGLRLDHALRIRVSEPTTIASKPVSSGLPTRIYLGKQGRTLEIEGWVATVAELNVLSALADGAVHEVQLPTGSRVSVHIPDVNPIRPVEPGKYPYTLRAVERMD